jgi:hypothetical protein
MPGWLIEAGADRDVTGNNCPVPLMLAVGDGLGMAGLIEAGVDSMHTFTCK